MKLYISILMILVVFSIGSCKKDGDDSSNTPDTGEISISIAGTLIDENGSGLQGAMVSVGNESKTTDVNGTFIFENVKVPKLRFYVSSKKEGFFDGGYGGQPTKDEMHYVRITMLAAGSPISLNSTSGGTVTTNNGGTIIFPPNAFITSTGSVFSGTVKVYTRHLSPDDPGFTVQFPGGDLAAMTASGELAPMMSYGMLGVTLMDNNNNPINLATGVTAEIRMPVAASQIGSAPATIPLVSFNPETGIWTKEGEAVKSGNEYIGTVNHFSWWNCDVIFEPPAPTVTGKVVDCNGDPVPGVVVTVNGQYSMITNNSGAYSNWVPTGTVITAQVLASNNGGVFYNSNTVSITPVSGNNFLPDLVVACAASISVQFLCDTTTVPAYVVATWSGGSSMLLFDPNGYLQVPVPNNFSIDLHFFCAQNDTTIVVTSGNAGTNVNLGSLQVCNPGLNSCSGGQSTVTDIDGNVYNVIGIGNQCWMAENLNVSRYTNGDSISTGIPDISWDNINYGAYAVNNNVLSYESIYGKLYNWYAVTDSRGVCPTGWHTPSDGEWNTMIKYLDPGADTIINLGTQSSFVGGALKSTGTTLAGTGLWMDPNSMATDLIGFTGLPAGYRISSGAYSSFPSAALFWTSTVSSIPNQWAHLRVLYKDNGIITKTRYGMGDGLSVRCVRD